MDPKGRGEKRDTKRGGESQDKKIGGNLFIEESLMKLLLREKNLNIQR